MSKIKSFFLWLYINILNLIGKCSCDCEIDKKCIKCNISLNGKNLFQKDYCIKCFLSEEGSHKNT